MTILNEKVVMKTILVVLSFLIFFFVTNEIIMLILGFDQADIFFVISELISGGVLTGTGRSIVIFTIIMFDIFGGLIGGLSMYFFLADKILNLLPVSFD